MGKGEGVVERGDGNVAAVEDFEGRDIRVQLAAGVEASESGLPGGGGADGARAEAGAGSIADSCVEGGSDYANVKRSGWVGQAFDVGEVRKG